MCARMFLCVSMVCSDLLIPRSIDVFQLLFVAVTVVGLFIFRWIVMMFRISDDLFTNCIVNVVFDEGFAKSYA